MAKYFDIHVKYDNRDCDGYSIGVIANDPENAVAVALSDNIFVEDGDEDYIDNVTEIDYDDYVALTYGYEICEGCGAKVNTHECETDQYWTHDGDRVVYHICYKCGEAVEGIYYFD